MAQVATVHNELPASDRETAVLLVTNYGEAGALVKYDPALGLPQAYSAHNELYNWVRHPRPRAS